MGGELGLFFIIILRLKHATRIRPRSWYPTTLIFMLGFCHQETVVIFYFCHRTVKPFLILHAAFLLITLFFILSFLTEIDQ